MTTDWIDIAGTAVICIGIFIFIPILLFYCYRFNGLPASSNMVKHRECALIYYMNVLSILSLLFERPFVVIINVFHSENAIHAFLAMPSWTMYITDSLGIWSVFVLFTIKSWLLFYNFEYHLSLTKLVWKREINPRYRSWFIMNKNKFGNLNYCICIIIIPFLLYIGLETLIEIILNEMNVFAHSMAILSLMAIIPSFILYRKLTRFDDVFGIKSEIFYQQIIIGVLIIILLFEFIADIIIKYESHDLVRIKWLINTLIASIVLFLMSFISVWYPIKLCHVEMETRLQHLRGTQIGSSSIGNSTSHKKESISIGVKSMLQILSDHKAFDAFMKHLVSEFATENLFFLMEYIQIKYQEQIKNNGIIKVAKPKYFDCESAQNINKSDEYLTIDFNAENNVNADKSISHIFHFDNFHKVNSVRSDGAKSYLFNCDGSLSSIVLLPAGLPKSELINQYKQFTQRLYALYLKYIKPGSIHEINISYFQRQEIAQKFQTLHTLKNNKKELEKLEKLEKLQLSMFNIMDEACNEILSLMIPAYNRFISSNNNNQFIHIQHAKKHKDKENVTKIELILRNGTSYSKLHEKYDES